jgi:hypothetical protein
MHMYIEVMEYCDAGLHLRIVHALDLLHDVAYHMPTINERSTTAHSTYTPSEYQARLTVSLARQCDETITGIHVLHRGLSELKNTFTHYRENRLEKVRKFIFQ